MSGWEAIGGAQQNGSERLLWITNAVGRGQLGKVRERLAGSPARPSEKAGEPNASLLAACA